MNSTLFNRWKTARPEYLHFNEDGIINEYLWNTLPQDKHILFILKETNRLPGSLTEFLNNGGNRTYGRTWNNIARWSNVILHSESERSANKEILKYVAAINLKKEAGAGSANKKSVRAYAEKDRDFLLEQIIEINPGIIITCGFDCVSNITHDIILSETNTKQLIDRTTDLCYYFSESLIPGKKIPVISLPHPNRAAIEYSNKLLSLYTRLITHEIFW